MNQSFEELLEQAGLTGYSQYFQQDPTALATALGLKGEQATQFGKFFMPFQQQKLVEAAEEIEAGRQQRLGMIGEQYAGQRMGAQQQFGQSMRQLSQQAAQTGFAGAGATQAAMERLRTGAGQTIQDILGRREAAMLGLEEQVGRQKAALTGMLHSYLQSQFGRAERLYGLDPGGVEDTPAYRDPAVDLPGSGIPSSQEDKIAQAEGWPDADAKIRWMNAGAYMGDREQYGWKRPQGG